jgi:signal transduction histidine kinase
MIDNLGLFIMVGFGILLLALFGWQQSRYLDEKNKVKDLYNRLRDRMTDLGRDFLTTYNTIPEILSDFVSVDQERKRLEVERITDAETASAAIDFMTEQLMETSRRLDEALTQIKMQNEEIIRQNEEIKKQDEEIRRQNQEIIRQNEKLRETDKLKNQFLAHVSHELRTPLNSVIGFADVLLQGMDGELSELQIADLGIIRDNGKYLLDLINGLLDLSRIEAGMMEINEEELNLGELIKDTLSTFVPLVKEKNLQLHTEIDRELPPVYADRTRIRQVITNLVGNAIKFTDEGDIRVRAFSSEEGVRVAVSDTGVGIYPEDIHAIFDGFHPARIRKRKGGLGGMGIGLAITKRIVELHGGTIYVDSVLGGGSTFYFTLPLRHSE